MEATPNLAPRRQDPDDMRGVILGRGAIGPQPRLRSLEAALDFVPDDDQDRGKSGGTLAAARATRRLRRDMAFDDVSNGLADDWFRDLRNGATRQWRVDERDLDNPAEVSREQIVGNYLRDPTSWDDDARAALAAFSAAEALSSRDPILRLPLGASASIGTWTTSAARRRAIDDVLRRKEAGLAVRFAFDVDVHHAADGAVTAIDVGRAAFERTLVEKVRVAVERAVAELPPPPPRVAGGGPFRSHWLFIATWYLDPPRPHLSSSSSMFSGENGQPSLLFGSTFDVGADGLTTQDVNVHLKTSAELLEVTPLRR